MCGNLLAILSIFGYDKKVSAGLIVVLSLKISFEKHSPMSDKLKNNVEELTIYTEMTALVVINVLVRGRTSNVQ